MTAKLTRRTFLQSTAAAAALASASASPLQIPANHNDTFVWPENGTLVPDEGWRLWPDTHAEWASDEIYLPEDVAWHDGKLCGTGKPLPVNAPTGGWGELSDTQGISVILPSSVEQHFWGKYGAGRAEGADKDSEDADKDSAGADGKPRPYTPEEYRYANDPAKGAPADDDVPQNGAYFGVSWWYREIDIPAAMAGKRIFLHIRGAHLRAEVYLNEQLCGYTIMEELPFEADLTHAAKPGGQNTLAIRITNPFGRFDWVDGLNARWGHVSLYRSHGFGALDRGMTITAHHGVRIRDAYVLNTSEPAKALAFVTLESTTGAPISSATCRFAVMDVDTNAVLSRTSNLHGTTDGGALTHVQQAIGVPDPKAWHIGSGILYKLQIDVTTEHGNDTCSALFAFRSFTPTGITSTTGTSNALFRLNGKRLKLYSSISWGFWGLNGIFPIPELAEKEVRTAQALGLNCLNFHRNLAKEDVLRWHDHLGVLRYMEPGAGKLAIGKLPPNAEANAHSVIMAKPTTDADKFAQRYMFERCVGMVRAFRGHPSVIIYCLQNELGADLANPATLAILEAMHREDPSRVVELNDGFEARGAAQAWYEPWSFDEHGTLQDGKLHRSDQSKFGDWWNNHQGAGYQWYDEFYKSPSDYTYKAPYKSILTEFGEMEGCARPDDHTLDIHQITETYKRYGGTSYDLIDHQEVLVGYEAFLTKWNFRAAFPTAEHVFRACGRTCYDSWQNYMENARISDDLDFAVISGWESTAIENHSGIVDNLRNPKSDPRLIGDTLAPVRPCAKQHSLVIERGQPATFDLYLFNDTSQPVAGTLTFSMITPSGTQTKLLTLPVPQNQQPDTFSYLLQEGFITPALSEEGLYRFRFALSSAPLATHTKELWITGSPIANVQCRTSRSIGVSGISVATRMHLMQTLHGSSCSQVEDFTPGEHYDVILTSGRTAHTSTNANIGETTGEAMPVTKTKPGHKPEPGETATPTQLGSFAPGILDAVRAGTPLLVLADADTLSDGLARELAAAGAFSFHGNVGDFRAPWMGNWYFVREHPLFAGMPVNCALGNFYQAPGRQSNGLLIDRAPGSPDPEIIVGYSRDHDRRVGAGTFTCTLGKGRIVFHRVPAMHPVMQQRFLANALTFLTFLTSH